MSHKDIAIAVSELLTVTGLTVGKEDMTKAILAMGARERTYRKKALESRDVDRIVYTREEISCTKVRVLLETIKEHMQ